MKNSTATIPRVERISIETTRTLLTRSKRAVIINLIASLFIFVFFFRISRHEFITYWLIAQFTLSLIRISSINYFLSPKRKLTYKRALNYRKISVILTSLAGILAGSLVFYPAPEPYSLHFFTFISFVLGGMVAGASTTLAASSPSLISYSFFTLSPVVFKFLSTNEGLFHMLALFVILFGVSLVIIGIENGKNIRSDLNNKYFNKKLFQNVLDTKKQIEKSRNFLEAIMNNSSNAIFVLDDNSRFKHVNPSLCQMTGINEKNLIGMNFLKIIHPADLKNFSKKVRQVLSGETTIKHSEIRIKHIKGIEININLSLSPLISGNKGQITGVVGTAENITDLKISEIFKAGRTRAMELLAQNSDLKAVFNDIIFTTQSIYKDSVASILLLDEKNFTIKNGSSPDLPDFFSKAIEGLKIGPNIGSCGSAMYNGETVIAEDIMTHPNWEPYRELARRANLQACWSEPIKGKAGKILGSFAVYYRSPKVPKNHEISLIKELAGIARIAIEKHEMEKEIERKTDELDFLHQISSSANQAKELHNFYEDIANSLKKLEKIGLENSVKIFSKENDYLDLVYSSETRIETDYCRRIELGQCLCGLSAKSNEIIFSENAVEDPRHTIINPEDDPIHGHVVVPIRVKNETTGVVCLYSREKEFKGYDEYKQMFLTAGNHIGEAISRNKLYDEVKNLSLRDSLTGLANRRKMAEFISHIFATTVRYEQDLSVIMFDIDHFKDFNDNHGHVKGDEILKNIGDLLINEGRRTDLHIRYGGEEFLIILPQTSLETAFKFAERIQKNIYEKIEITVSIGIAELNAVESFDDLIKRVDRALYRAKENGRNRIEQA